MSSKLKAKMESIKIHHGYMTGPPQINDTMAAFQK